MRARAPGGYALAEIPGPGRNPGGVIARITWGVVTAALRQQTPMSVMCVDGSLAEGLSDEALLAGMAAGEVGAGTAFVRRHQSRVFGLAWMLVGDPDLAEDVAQETFVRAWRHGAGFDPRKGSVRSWLFRITQNLAIDALRMRRAEPMAPETLLARLALDDDPVDHITRLEDAERMRVALRGLPAPQQRALVLAAYLGRTAEEISRIEHIPLGTAKTRIRAAMLRLRATLGEEACR